MADLIIELSGGLVSWVSLRDIGGSMIGDIIRKAAADGKLRIFVVDDDTEGAEEDELTKTTSKDGDEIDAVVSEWDLNDTDQNEDAGRIMQAWEGRAG